MTSGDTSFSGPLKVSEFPPIYGAPERQLQMTFYVICNFCCATRVCRIWYKRSLQQEGCTFDPGFHLNVSDLLLTKYANYFLHFKNMHMWQIGNSKLSSGVSVWVHSFSSATCPGGTLPSLEDNWDQLQQSEQRTFGLWRMLVILCFGCDGPVKQAKPAAGLANPFEGFSLLSLFSSHHSSSQLDFGHFQKCLKLIRKYFTEIIQQSVCCDSIVTCYRENEALFIPKIVAWPKRSLARSWPPVEKHWTASWHHNTSTTRAEKWQPAAGTSQHWIFFRIYFTAR